MSLVVRCRENSLASLRDEFLDDRRGYRSSTTLPLSVGAQYDVFAISSFLGGFWYYVLDDDRHRYPVWYPAPVFDIVSETVPEGWVLAHHRTKDGGVTSILSFPEWASDPHYYERLVDDDPEAVTTFAQVRSSLLAEDRDGVVDR